MNSQVGLTLDEHIVGVIIAKLEHVFVLELNEP